MDVACLQVANQDCVYALAIASLFVAANSRDHKKKSSCASIMHLYMPELGLPLFWEAAEGKKRQGLYLTSCHPA
jgi:hypothetical protein